MTTTTQIPTKTADRIATEVLTATYIKSCGGLELTRSCSCQHGRCGHCGVGDHGRCTTRVSFNGKPPAQPLTYVVDRRGGALASVWPSGTACRWVCSCTDCPTGDNTATQAPAAHRKARGDLRPDDTVWLQPKTLACPAICWTQPRATVVATQGLYVVVKVGRQQHRIHVDNIRRSDPGAAHGVVNVKAKPRPQMPDGFEEQSLF
ncbi:DUF6248 family natural product biosynthesis protein [Nucisporomicrobium flavum]|uniref:DUF6248 family natural product biosynthesis protein n=1 Tax=Nucisporomicrobium flavum TaxID=2785915 RepID=UPI0018F35EBA|nr:DUF6248 family natural product biosynthesis protein [Nucisporomicrobium flavum]